MPVVQLVLLALLVLMVPASGSGVRNDRAGDKSDYQHHDGQHSSYNKLCYS